MEILIDKMTQLKKKRTADHIPNQMKALKIMKKIANTTGIKRSLDILIFIFYKS